VSRIKTEYRFLAGVYHNEQLYFNNYVLNLDFYTNTDSVPDQSIGLDRISFCVNDIFHQGIFIVDSNFADAEKLALANIPTITIPGPGPYDPMVLATIVTKLNTVLEDTLIITDAELTSSLGGDLTYVWELGDEEDEIHAMVNDEDEFNWWASPQPRFVSYQEDVDIADCDEKNNITWSALNLDWTDEELEESEEVVTDTSSTVIKMSDFNKPKKKK